MLLNLQISEIRLCAVIMTEGFPDHLEADRSRSSPLTALRVLWLLLVGVVSFIGWVSGMEYSMIGLVLLLALPAVVGLLETALSRSGENDSASGENELSAWVLTATVAIALTGGGGSPFVILFALAPAFAAAQRQPRLAFEAASFGVAGYLAAMLLESMGIFPDIRPGVSAVAGWVVLAALFQVVACFRIMFQQKDAQRQSAEAALRKALEVETARARTAIKKAENAEARIESQALFFAQTSHELRTPLNAIIGFSEMIKAQLFGPVSDRYAEYASLIHEGGHSLQLIVDDILDLSKIEAGQYRIHPIDMDFVAEIRQAVRFMEDQAAREKVSLSFKAPDELEGRADPRAVRQVVLNLVSNAIKHSPARSSVSVELTNVEGDCVLSVRDEGKGLPQDEFAKLLQPFAQADKEKRGTGLGLSVAQAFMGLHGGGLSLKPKAGEGACIEARFPSSGSLRPS